MIFHCPRCKKRNYGNDGDRPCERCGYDPLASAVILTIRPARVGTP